MVESHMFTAGKLWGQNITTTYNISPNRAILQPGDIIREVVIGVSEEDRTPTFWATTKCAETTTLRPPYNTINNSAYLLPALSNYIITFRGFHVLYRRTTNRFSREI
jgi:hypothetical protein